jgi:hypothetical protein
MKIFGQASVDCRTGDVVTISTRAKVSVKSAEEPHVKHLE